MAITFHAVSTVATTTSNSITPNLPTYTTGDLLLLVVNGGYLTATTPTGWTKIGSTVTATNTSAGSNIPRVDGDLFWKIAGASETAPSISLSSGSFSQFQRCSSIMLSITGAGGIQAFADAATSITTTAANTPIVDVQFGGGTSYSNGSGIWTTSFTSSPVTETVVADVSALLVTSSGNASYGISVGFGTQTTAGASGTITANQNSISASTAITNKIIALSAPTAPPAPTPFSISWY